MLIKLNEKMLTALPIFIAMNIAAVAVWLLNISAQSIALFLGIIAAGLVDLDNRLSGRLKNIFSTLIAFSIASLVTQYFLGKGAWFVLVMTAMTFLFTMIGALGQRYSTIAFGTLTVSVYNTLTYTPDSIWYLNPLLILAGTLLYSFCTIAVHLCFPNRPLQARISQAYLILADYLEAKAAFFDPDDVERIGQKQLNLAMKNSQLITAFNECRMALFYRMRGNHRHSYTAQMSRYYFTAQDIHERANSSHFDYQLLETYLKNSDLIFRVLRLLDLQAKACRDVALCLQQKQTFQMDSRLERAISGLHQSFELFSQHCSSAKTLLHVKTLINNLQNTHWQLQSLSQQGQPPQQVEQVYVSNENIGGLKRIFSAIGSQLNLQSQLFRHAIRLSILVFACCTLIEVFELQLQRGYWILLTIIFVCQPNYSATKLRLKQRVIGTILGVLIGSLLPYIAPTLEVKLGVVVITSTLFYFFRINNYSFSTFFITLQVLATFDIVGFDIYEATIPRIIDTLIGTGFAWLAVSYLWPDWKYLQLGKVIQQAIQNDAKYLLHIVAHLEFGKGDNLKYRLARNNAHESATALSTIMTNMNNEPKKYAPYLQQGFELLRLNTALLGYISALGAYRRQSKGLQDMHCLSEFTPAAKKIIALLENMAQHNKTPKSAVQFEQSFQQIQSYLANYAENSDNAQTSLNIPMQQLWLICQLLPALYAAMQQTQNIVQDKTEIQDEK